MKITISFQILKACWWKKKSHVSDWFLGFSKRKGSSDPFFRMAGITITASKINGFGIVVVFGYF